MSTVVTQSEVVQRVVHRPSDTAALLPSGPAASAKKHRPAKFTRSKSIERIIKINTYICSQSCFFLPALLGWLKTSKGVLETTLERHIVLLRSTFLALAIAILTSRRATALKVTVKSWLRLAREALRFHLARGLEVLACQLVGTLEAAKMVIILATDPIVTVVESSKEKLLALMVYLCMFLIFFQLLTCVFVMFTVLMPGGLVFLLACLYLIAHINIRLMFSYIKNQDLKLLKATTSEESSNSDSTASTATKPKKAFLTEKTISNIRLF